MGPTDRVTLSNLREAIQKLEHEDEADKVIVEKIKAAIQVEMLSVLMEIRDAIQQNTRARPDPV